MLCILHDPQFQDIIPFLKLNGDHFRVGDHFGGCTVPNSLTVYAAERVFTTRILPKLDYCDFVWNNSAPPRYKSFERLQTRAARIYCSEGQQLLRQLSWKSIKAHSTMHNLTFVFTVSVSITLLQIILRVILSSLHIFITLGIMVQIF